MKFAKDKEIDRVIRESLNLGMTGVSTMDVLDSMLGNDFTQYELLKNAVLHIHESDGLPEGIADCIGIWMIQHETKESVLHGMEILEKLCELESPISLYNLANLKTDGKHTRQDAESAISLCKRAINHPKINADLKGNAICLMGHFYLNGQGCERQLRKARNLFEDAAKLGNGEGAFNASRFYRGMIEDWNDSIDLEKAAQLLAIGVQAKHVLSKTHLGYMHFRGQIAEANLEHGVDLIKQAACEGNGEAMQALVLINKLQLPAKVRNINEEQEREKIFAHMCTLESHKGAISEDEYALMRKTVTNHMITGRLFGNLDDKHFNELLQVIGTPAGLSLMYEMFGELNK